MSYLPEARSDYIAAIYAEESGFVGMLALVSVYMCLGYCGFRMAMCCPDRSAFRVPNHHPSSVSKLFSTWASSRAPSE